MKKKYWTIGSWVLYAGERKAKIGKITLLSPIYPMSSNNPPIVKFISGTWMYLSPERIIYVFEKALVDPMLVLVTKLDEGTEGE